MDEGKNPLLSISMLVSNNRTDTIVKCMESLLPLRKNVPCELILVDTGCTDGGIELARPYADRVVQFTWCNDFSVARNAGLSLCGGEWFLYLDDDEWFEDIEDILRFFKSGEYKNYEAAWYLQRNYSDFEGTAYSDVYVGRMYRNVPGLRFCGKIHEWLEPTPSRIAYLSSYVHHYGYVFRTKEEEERHFLRNLTLEEEAVKEHPDDIRMCCQLIQEYCAAKRYAEAETLCKKALRETKYGRENAFVQHLLAPLPKIYVDAGREADARAELLRLEREEKLSGLATLTVLLEKMYWSCRANKPEAVLEEAEAYLRAVEDKKLYENEYPVMDFSKYSSKKSIQAAVQNGCKAMLQLEQFEKATFFFSKVDWNGNKEQADWFIKVLLLCYQKTGDKTLFEVLQGTGVGIERQAGCVLSISMLISNGRRDTIEKSMKSLLPLREAISSELILVDTGCTDGGIELARPYADKVIEFTWCNDFSAARNAGLYECTGEWFLYLDDDEWFEDVSELIEFFRSGEYKDYAAGEYIQRNYEDYAGTAYTNHYASRMSKLYENSTFVGKVHEYVDPTGGKVKYFNCFVHHYGYVFKTLQDKLEHQKRNQTLIMEELEKDAQNARMYCQLVGEYCAMGAFEKALQIIEKGLAELLTPVEHQGKQYLLISVPKIFTDRGEWEAAYKEYNRLEQEGKLNFYHRRLSAFEQANCLWQMKQFEAASEQALRYLESLVMAEPEGEAKGIDYAQYKSEVCRSKAIFFVLYDAYLKLSDGEMVSERAWKALETVDTELLQKALRLCLEQVERERLIGLQEQLLASEESFPGEKRIIWITGCVIIAEQLVLFLTEQKKADLLEEEVQFYTTASLCYGEWFYSEEELYQLPPAEAIAQNVKFALWMQQAFLSKNFEEVTVCMKEAAQSYPALTNVVRVLLGI